ncbi:MAG TPA: hypothetical protein VK611_13700 [Acidimicrobiales bacterium]|nr:hypothetical protein [Acidimicrobiales bacterium]
MADATTDEISSGRGLDDVTRAVAAAGLVGAGVIHFAYAPVHLDEELSHGIFFLVTGWLQLALAAGLVLRARPQRLWLGATAAVNLAVVAVWVVSRTVGVPGSEKEGVAFPDVAATLLELTAVAAAVVLLTHVLGDRPVAGNTLFGGVGLGAVATVVIVSMAVSPTFAGEHSHGADGDDHGHADGSDMAGMEGMDHGHGVRVAGQDLGTEEWAEYRFDALAGYASDEEVEQFEALEAEYLTEQIWNRSDLVKELPKAEADELVATYVDWAVENTIALLEGAQSGDPEVMHSHGPVEWQPVTDPDELLELQQQLEASGKVIEQFPTVADAEAGGYYQISPYVPGIGAHWINGDLDGTFDPADPEMLLFNGTEPTSRIVGLSYATVGDQAPEGFVGPNDTWHAHPALCTLRGFVVGIDGTPEELCESIGGNIASGLADLHMAHLWQVPGFESPWGLFSAENPLLSVTTSDLGRSLRD